MICEKGRNVLVELDQKGIICAVSASFTAVFGYAEETLTNKPLSSIVCATASEEENNSLEDNLLQPQHLSITTQWDTVVDVLLVPYGQKKGDQKINQFLITFLEPLRAVPTSLTDPQVFQQIYDKAAVGVALVSPTGRVLHANKTFTSYLGYSEAELQTMTFPEFTHEEDTDTDVEYYRQLLNAEIEDYQMEKRYITRDQKVFWVNLSVSLVRDMDGAVKYAVAVIQNIDKRKKSELALRDYKVRLEKAFQGAKEAVWHWLDPKANEQWWSPNFSQILGYEPDELTPGYSTFSSLLNPRDKKKVEVAVQNHFENNQPFDIDYRLRTKKGTYKWVNAKGVAERDEQGIPTEMIGIIADIDHIKKAENLLKQRYIQLEQSNKELENFAYVASHDLQEPLRTINSFLQLFEMSLDTPLNEENASYLATVSKASLRMRKLIEDLLEYSRVGRHFETGQVDMAELLNEISSDLTAQLEESGGCLIIKSCIPVNADKGKLYRLFKNLISNALKFRKTDTPPIVTIDSELQITKRRVQYSVTDNGIGIDQAYYKTVFDIFKRLHTRDEYAGSGIGLSICKKIVELHSGKISVESDLGVGSKFIFDLPKT